MDEDFKIGDVVILKSGGPRMTIVGEVSSTHKTNMPKYFKCVWFNKDFENKCADFHIDALIKIQFLNPES